MTFDLYSKLDSIAKLPVETEGDITRKGIAQYAAVRGTTVEELESLPVQELISIIKNTTIPSTLEGGTVVYSFLHNGIPYDLIESIDDMNLYQFSDASKYIHDGDYLSAFVVCTYNRDSYRQSDKLIRSFARRVEDLRDLDSSIWYPYMNEIVKKKNMQIYSTVGSLSLTQVKELETQTIKTITQLMESQHSAMKQEKGFWSKLLYYILIPLKDFIIWGSTRIAPELLIKLLSKRL
jgi:hypothetical protein